MTNFQETQGTEENFELQIPDGTSGQIQYGKFHMGKMQFLQQIHSFERVSENYC